MNIEQLIDRCIECSISLTLDGEQGLKVKAPKGALTADIVAELKNRKSELVDWLKQQDAERRTRPIPNGLPRRLLLRSQLQWMIGQMTGQVRFAITRHLSGHVAAHRWGPVNRDIG